MRHAGPPPRSMPRSMRCSPPMRRSRKPDSPLQSNCSRRSCSRCALRRRAARPERRSFISRHRCTVSSHCTVFALAAAVQSRQLERRAGHRLQRARHCRRTIPSISAPVGWSARATERRVARSSTRCLRAAAEGTPAYGDALFWHGALAETAADAERDYRRVIVEYPLSRYADDALLSLAELEQARGDRTAAYQHLQRFVREHPMGPARARAGLAAARLAFEQRDMTRGCAMIADARRSAGSTRRGAAQPDRLLRRAVSDDARGRRDSDADRGDAQRSVGGLADHRIVTATELGDAACQRQALRRRMRRRAPRPASRGHRHDPDADSRRGADRADRQPARGEASPPPRHQRRAASGPSSSPRTTRAPMRRRSCASSPRAA